MDNALRLACARAVHLRTADGQWLRAGRAVLATLALIGWPRTARLLSLPPLIQLVELGYGVVAANRRFFSRFLFRQE